MLGQSDLVPYANQNNLDIISTSKSNFFASSGPARRVYSDWRERRQRVGHGGQGDPQPLVDGERLLQRVLKLLRKHGSENEVKHEIIFLTLNSYCIYHSSVCKIYFFRLKMSWYR